MTTLTLDGVELRFTKLTLDDEAEWTDWLAQRLLGEAWATAKAIEMNVEERTAYMAKMTTEVGAGRCGLLTTLGINHMTSPAGMAKILSMASRQHHPSPRIDAATLMRIINEQPREARRVVAYVLPFKEIGEKKPTAGPTDGQH